MPMNNETLKYDPSTGLIPAIVQDASSGRVLMLGYMNKESLEMSLHTGYATFFSRSRNALWTKGETSGNRLRIVSIADDCDFDALLVKAHAEGPTCHTGLESCFDAGTAGSSAETGLPFLAYLESFLKDRKTSMPEGSYTSKMFAKGLDKIAQKVGEEAVETVIAAKNENQNEFIYEASDLLFHLILLLVEKGIPLNTLIDELKRRHS